MNVIKIHCGCNSQKINKNHLKELPHNLRFFSLTEDELLVMF